VLGFALTGCGSSNSTAVDATPSQDGATQDGGPHDGPTPAGTMVLTSPAFAEGATIPTANMCDGANTSPMLSWTGAPSGTQSRAARPARAAGGLGALRHPEAGAPPAGRDREPLGSGQRSRGAPDRQHPCADHRLLRPVPAGRADGAQLRVRGVRARHDNAAGGD